jgi:hypothetical protein
LGFGLWAWGVGLKTWTILVAALVSVQLGARVLRPPQSPPGMVVLSNIAGTVRGSRGEPAVAARVRALRRTFVSGRPRFTTAAETETDERGQYRLAIPIAGRYIVAVSAGLDPSTMDARGEFTTWVHPTTFFPNASTPDSAAILDFLSGRDQTGIDFSLASVRSVSITGHVVGPSGPMANIVPKLAHAGDDAADLPVFAGSISLLADGTFKYFGVPRGRYVLSHSQEESAARTGAPLPLSFNRLATVLGATRALWGSLAVNVGETDVLNLTLELLEPAQVFGTLEIEGNTSVPNRVAPLAVRLEPVTGRGEVRRMTITEQSNPAAVTARVPPGQYVVRVDATGWALKSAMIGGRDVTEEPLIVGRNNVTGLVVTVTRHLAEISGVVADAAGSGATVVIFPTAETSWRNYGVTPRRLQVLRVDAGGAYRSGGLPPGSYFVAATTASLTVEDLDPAMLSAMALRAARVDVRDADVIVKGL